MTSVTATTTFSDAAPGRRVDLDWIRICAFGLLILYHVGMFYVTWDWHVKSPSASHAIEPLMYLTSPWRLTLLFLVSGAATAFMASKMGAGALTWSRIWRLLPPLLLAMLVIVPPQSWYEIYEKAPQLSEAYPGFWVKYATASGGWCHPVTGECLITPTWNHMWFVAYLLVYSLVLGLLLAVARGGLERLGAGLERTLRGWGLLLWPIAFLAAARVGLLPLFEVTHALVDDWYNHAVSFAAFMLGFLLARREAFWAEVSRRRWLALALWIVAYAVFTPYAWAYRGEDVNPPEALRTAMRVVWAAGQWAAIVAVLGFGRLWFAKDGPVRRYLTDAVFTFYLVHQTIIVVAAHHLAQLGLPLAVEVPVLVATTFGGCWLTYEAVRRVGFLRPWFGLKPLPRRRVSEERLASEMA